MSTAEKLLDSLVAVNIELRAWADPNTQKLGVQAETLAGDLVIEHGDLLAALKEVVADVYGDPGDAPQTCPIQNCPACALEARVRAVIARAEGGDER